MFYSSHRFFSVILIIILWIFASSQSFAQTATELANTDLFGSDYKGFDLEQPDPKLCAKACIDDTECKAYTYLKPGIRGPVPQCFLKNAVPEPTSNSCCVSGVKQITLNPAILALKTKPAAPVAKSDPAIIAIIPPKTETKSNKPLNKGVTAVDPKIKAVKSPNIFTPLIIAPVKPEPLGRGEAQGSLNGVSPQNFPKCQGNAVSEAIFDIFDKVAGHFGGNLSRDAHCGTYKRELAAGVTTASAPANISDPDWDFIGGRGDVMSDSALCLMKDIGERPDGKVTRNVEVAVAGIAEISLRQTLGLSRFDPETREAELFHQIEVCAPIMGCLDAQRQNIKATIQQSNPAWPGKMRAGDYPVQNSYSVLIDTEWADSSFAAELPPIPIKTPYGDVTVQPKFNYSSSLYPIDGGFSKHNGARVFLNYPTAVSPSNQPLHDLYGRSGTPFLINLVSHLPVTTTERPDDWPEGIIFIPEVTSLERPVGWSSQLMFGSRNGRFDKSPWSPSTTDLWPARADLNLDEPRNMLERTPSANFVAQSPIKFSPPMSDILDKLPGIAGLINTIALNITVNPRFGADYAAQLGIIEREGRIDDCTRHIEVTYPCGLAETLLYTQARAEGRADIVTSVNVIIDFNFSMPFFDPDINETFGATIDLGGGGPVYDPVTPSSTSYNGMARAAVIADDPKTDLASHIKGFSGLQSSDIRGWTQQCMMTPPKQVASAPPPSYTPGNADDLLPDLLPCNICVADNRQDRYDPFYLPDETKTPASYPASKNWNCEWQENKGCYDMCEWKTDANGQTRFTTAKISAVDLQGERCRMKEFIIK